MIVASRRNPAVFYEVQRDSTGWRCTCPGYQFRHSCRHIKEATMAFNTANYVPVAERLADAQDGLMAIEADPPIMLDAAMGYIRVQVYLSDGRKATGTASFRLDLQGKGAQATNPIEDCETSAVGRALAFLGYSSSRSIASREEVQEAQRRERSQIGARYQNAPAQAAAAQAQSTEITPRQAEEKFYYTYAKAVGGRTWHHVATYLAWDKDEWKPETAEDWRTVASHVIARQKANAAESESVPA